VILSEGAAPRPGSGASRGPHQLPYGTPALEMAKGSRSPESVRGRMHLRRLMSSPEPRTRSASGAAPTGAAGTAHIIPETTARSSIRPLASRSTGLHGSDISDAGQHAGRGRARREQRKVRRFGRFGNALGRS